MPSQNAKFPACCKHLDPLLSGSLRQAGKKSHAASHEGIPGRGRVISLPVAAVISRARAEMIILILDTKESE